MQSPAGRVHIVRPGGCVQPRKLQAEPRGMGRLNPGLRTFQEECFNSAMPEAHNHMYIVSLQDTKTQEQWRTFEA